MLSLHRPDLNRQSRQRGLLPMVHDLESALKRTSDGTVRFWMSTSELGCIQGNKTNVTKPYPYVEAALEHTD